MKTFKCYCGYRVYFENSQCINCGRELGYLSDQRSISALGKTSDELWRALGPPGNGALYRKCTNYVEHAVCNWMVPVDDPLSFCEACRLNEIIPDLSQPKHRQYWYKLERAKRYMLYSISQLGLPIMSKNEDPTRGVAFLFLVDKESTSEFTQPIPEQTPTPTGHAGGRITINLAEADDIARTRIREQMRERYRTLLGHFRHEIGHYYWELLIPDSDFLGPFRECFGDERRDYQQALAEYYRLGPPDAWETLFISAYAASHPWEDWAESWAHYVLMFDALETAYQFGFSVEDRKLQSPAEPLSVRAGQHAPRLQDFDVMFEQWTKFSIAINGINRSMGLRDAYPFAPSLAVRNKLRFIHKIIDLVSRPETHY
nr:putative zinc-binding peptidase [Gammaproteobacteria bacterium]